MALQDFRCQVFGLLGGSLPWSFSFRLTSTDSEGTIAGRLDTAVGTLWTTSTSGLAAHTNADITLEGSSVATLNSTQHEVSKTVTNRHVAGTNANPSLPWQTAVTIGQFSSTNIQKRYRGRIHLPPPAVDAIGAHVYTSTFTGHLKTGFDAFWPAVRAGTSTYYSANANKLVDNTGQFEHHTLDKYHISDKPGRVERRVEKIVPTFTVSSL